MKTARKRHYSMKKNKQFIIYLTVILTFIRLYPMSKLLIPPLQEI